MDDKKEMIDKVKKILREVTSADPESKELLSGGGLTSFDIIGLVMELRDAFGIKVKASAITAENFDSAECIANMILRENK